MKISIKKRIVKSFCVLILLILIAQLGFNIFLSKTFFVMQNKIEVKKLYNTIVEYYSDEPNVLYALTRDADSTLGYSVQIFSEEEMIYTSRTMGDDVVGARAPLSVENDINTEMEEPAMGMEGPPELRMEGGPTGGPGNVPPQNSPQSEEITEQRVEEIRAYKPGDARIRIEDYQENPDAEIIVSSENGMEVLTIRGKIDYEGESRYINIALPMESITNSIALFTQSNIVISIIVLLFGIWVVIELANSITKPIKSMQKLSENLANLDFSNQLDEDAKTEEISGLARSINSMSDQLEKAMSELQIANEELQKDVERQKELETMRKQFVANVSHEMKTPLALVQIYCDNLKNNVEGIDRDQYCDIIIEETGRLNKIVGDMLNVAHLENELLQPYKRELDFTETTKNLLITMQPLFEAYEIEEEIEENLFVTGDKEQLEEAMRNYIMNAISHTEDGDKIKIKANKTEQKVCFSVYNKGKQIEEKHMDRLWESFYKSNDARTRTHGSNAGLGLYVVKVTMDNHKGACAVENKKDGVEFTFTLDSQNKS